MPRLGGWWSDQAAAGESLLAKPGLDEETPLIMKVVPSIPQGMEFHGGFCGGILADYRRRLPLMLSDWTTSAWSPKTLSSALFMFFATFTSTLALGEHISADTHGLIGSSEYFMMNSAAGILHSCIGCQPLVVLRPTGPITMLITELWTMSTSRNLPFWPFLAWTGLFVGLFMFLIAALEVSRFMRYVTPFTENIFAFFVCTIYVKDGLEGMRDTWNASRQVILDAHMVTGENGGVLKAATSLMSLNFTILFVIMALVFASLHSARIFTPRVRTFLVDYALTMTLLISCFAAACIDRYFTRVPFIDGGSIGFKTSSARPWKIELTEQLDAHGILLAALVAVPIVAFFYLDQNLSSTICQKPCMKLSKGAYYHSTFACMAGFNILGPLIGLPFVTGSLPHSPQFVQSLTELDKKGNPVMVKENRASPLLMYGLMALPLCIPSVLSFVPKAAVSGTLMFVGLHGIHHTQLYDRCVLIFTDPDCYPEGVSYVDVPAAKTHLFTLLQLLAVTGAWVANALFGLAFPLFVVALIPFRLFVMPLLFAPSELEDLDQELPERVQLEVGSSMTA